MLYLDYSRKAGEWIPNKFGGNENLEAVDFLRRFNIEVYKEQPAVQTIAEESTSFPLVSRPTYLGGLGFGMKWDMGWMHDTLSYISHEPIPRKFHHNNRLIRILRAEQALHELDFAPAGFSWIDVTDAEQSIVSLIRRGRSPEDVIVGVFNFTPVPRQNYQIGIPQAGRWLELLNSDAPLYGGSGQGNLGGVEAVPIGVHGHRPTPPLTLHPPGALFPTPTPSHPHAHLPPAAPPRPHPPLP